MPIPRNETRLMCYNVTLEKSRAGAAPIRAGNDLTEGSGWLRSAQTRGPASAPESFRDWATGRGVRAWRSEMSASSFTNSDDFFDSGAIALHAGCGICRWSGPSTAVAAHGPLTLDLGASQGRMVRNSPRWDRNATPLRPLDRREFGLGKLR